MLFARTLFQKDCIFNYPSRTDTLVNEGGEIKSTSSLMSCWTNHIGGAEGVRQKGWTCGGTINIWREARTRNTMIKDLEQGDKQIVVTF